MSITLSHVSRIGDQFAYQNTDLVGFNTILSAGLLNKYQMSYGAQANDSNNTITVPTKYYEVTHIISIASSTYDIDLTLLTDTYGIVLNFSKIYKLIFVGMDVSGGSGFVLKPGPSNGWTGPFNGQSTGQIPARARGRIVLEDPDAGFTVNGGTKVLRIQNDAASPSGNASFNLHLFGG